MSRKNRRNSQEEVLETMEMAEEVAVEEVKVQPKVEAEPEEAKVEFDGWWAVRQSKIPAQHRKEIVKADFKGRGMTNVGTMSAFDAALKLYGVKL